MNYFKWLILMLTILHFAEAKELQLKELIEVALKNAPESKSSQATLSISKLQKENSFSAFLPSLDISTNQGYRQQKPQPFLKDWGSDLNLTLSSSLYNNGINLINYKRSKLNLKRQQIQFDRTIANICLSITNEYFNYSLLKKILNIQKDQLKLVKKQFSSTKFLYQQGRKTRIDFIRLKSRLQREKLAVSQATVNIRKSLEDLKQLTAWKGSSLNIKIKPISIIKHKEFPTKEINFKNHYDFRISEINKSLNIFNVDLEKRKNRLEFFLNAGATYTNSDYLSGKSSFSNDYQLNWSAILTVNFNLWDWGIRKRSIAIVRNEVNRDNFTIDNDLLTLKSNLNKLTLDINQLKGNYFLNKELVSLEKKNYSTIIDNYRRGKSSFLDLINSLDNFTNAKISYLNSYYQLKNLFAQYSYHQGTIYEKINNY